MKESIVNPRLLKPIFSLLGKSKLPILIYHRVHKKIDPMQPGEVDAATFDWQMRLIAKTFNVLPLSTAVELLRKNRLPTRPLSITFDDGYADNAEVALPILKKYQLPATFFVAAGYIDGGRMWNDTVYETIRTLPDGEYDFSSIGAGRYLFGDGRGKNRCAQELIVLLKHLPSKERDEQTSILASMAKRELTDKLMMSSQQIKMLSESGMDIGGHTMTHPILSNLTPEEALTEIKVGKETLEQIVGRRIRLFAYPNGKPGQDYNQDHVSMVRELGFDAAVSTAWGVSNWKSDIYQLRRFTPWDRHQTAFMLRLLRNYFEGSS